MPLFWQPANIVSKIKKNLNFVSKDVKIFIKGRLLRKAVPPTDNKNKGSGVNSQN